MIDNHDATVRTLMQYLVDNAPPGAPRDVARMKEALEHGQLPCYLGMEFRPEEDVGCQLYVRVEGVEGQFSRSRSYDAEGNEWYAYRVTCEVSWSSWGSAPTETCQRRLACMTSTLRFACDVERAFSGVFHKLERTAAQIAEDNERYAKERAKQRVVDLVKKNAKGMKVGQERLVLATGGEGFVPEVGQVDVEREEAGRRFKYRAIVTSKDGFCFTRVA